MIRGTDGAVVFGRPLRLQLGLEAPLESRPTPLFLNKAAHQGGGGGLPADYIPPNRPPRPVPHASRGFSCFRDLTKSAPEMPLSLFAISCVSAIALGRGHELPSFYRIFTKDILLLFVAPKTQTPVPVRNRRLAPSAKQPLPDLRTMKYCLFAAIRGRKKLRSYLLPQSIDLRSGWLDS